MWNGLIRGYGPLVMLVAVIVLIAVFVPSKPPASTNAVEAGPGFGLEPTTPEPGANTNPAQSQSQTQTQTQTSTPQTGLSGVGHNSSPTAASNNNNGTNTNANSTPPGSTGPCAGRTVQVLGDSYSPPCVAFSGNNGGATWRGVTPTEIKIAVRYTPADKGFQQSVAQVAGAHLIDTQTDVDRTISALATYFNNNFQFYGRKIVPVFYNGVGSLANETLGEGQAETEADATTVAQQLKAFGDLTAGSEPYADDLARQGVLAFGDPYMSGQWHEQHAPYAWSIAPDLSKLENTAAVYYNQRLAGHDAAFAGPALQHTPRKLAVVSAENSWYQDSIGPAEQILKQSGTNAENIKYQLDINTLSNQAANIIPKLQADGVTTIMCACDPILPLFLSATASRAGYFPEFYITGTALTDVDLVGQLWSQDFTSHAFGLSGLEQLGPPTESLGYEAYKQVRSDEPAASVQIIYYQMYQLAIGLQEAGPDLTPQTFAQGMFRYPAHNGEDGLWQYSPTNYTATNDVREIYWESTAVSTYDNMEGAYLDPNPGVRYTINDLPHGEPVYKNFPGPINPNAAS